MLKSLWRARIATDAVFLADYAINPLGVKSDTEIAEVVERWLTQAAEVSDTLVIACNTLSVRYHQLYGSERRLGRLAHVVSMADCFAEMVEQEADRIAGKNLLVIGTEFTANQSLYSEIVAQACPGANVSTFAATELEQKIARFGTWEGATDPTLTGELRRAIDRAEIAILACTCFPMVREDLEAVFPDVLFLDPGAYSAGLMRGHAGTRDNTLSVTVTGEEVSSARVVEFAESYLGVSTCCT